MHEAFLNLTVLKTSPSYCPVGDLRGTNLLSISLGSCRVGSCLLNSVVVTAGTRSQWLLWLQVPVSRAVVCSIVTG